MKSKEKSRNIFLSLTIVLIIVSASAWFTQSCEKNELEDIPLAVQQANQNQDNATDANLASQETDDTERITPRLELHMGACLGECPAYTLLVYPDGTALFQGRAFTAVEKAEFKVNAQQMRQIDTFINLYQFYNLDPEYQEVPDAQTVEVAYTIDEKTHRVKGSVISVPSELNNFINALHELLDIDQFIHAETAELPANQRD